MVWVLSERPDSPPYFSKRTTRVMVIGEFHCSRGTELTHIQVFHGENSSECMEQARNHGWILTEEHHLCPKCAKKEQETRTEA